MDTPQAAQRYYSLERLTELARSLPLQGDNLALLRAQVGEQLDRGEKDQAHEAYRQLEAQRDAMAACLREARAFLLELAHPLAEPAAALAAQLERFRLMTRDYARLTRAVNAFASGLPTRETVSAAGIGRLMNHVRMGFYPTDPGHVDLLARGIAFPDQVQVNLLDPCCGAGAALARLGAGQSCTCFGVELDAARAEAAQAVLHRVGFGSFFHSRISPGCFHAILLNPPYLSVMTEGGGRGREEKRFLLESIPLLAMGGLLIYIVPCHRMTEDICQVFCDNFAQVGIYRFMDSEFRKYRQAAVLGLRRRRTPDDEGARRLFQAADCPEELPTLDTLPPQSYPLPDRPLKVPTFRGAVFNEAELARQLSQSSSLDRFLARRRADTDGRQPPLPLSVGQVGLIGGSGLFNGLMDCAWPHIVKGRIVKERRTHSEQNRSAGGKLVSTTHYETISNRMIFNILTPNGFRSLA